MRQQRESYSEWIHRLYRDESHKVRSITLQITDDCNLCCNYCYQHNKKHNKMDFETAKNFIDLLLTGNNKYINFSNTYGMVIEFIGGEPLLNIELMDKITDYTLNKMIKEKHPWLFKTRFSVNSNGTLYFNEKFQNYLKKYNYWISMAITLDGNKELHDSCRLFPDGSGSYDLALEAIKHYKTAYKKSSGGKLTFSSNNISHVYEGIINMINIGEEDILGNCVFENVWSFNEAIIFYKQLKKVANYVLENNLDKKISINLFNEDFFKKNINDKNYCGGNGEMLAIDYKGDMYPCLRFMESSLGENVKPIIIGNLKHGLEYTAEEKQWVKDLQSMTATSQSTQECIDCPIAEGCGWCSAYNYEHFGCLNKRATFICCMHKARALANVYYWNLYYKKNNINKIFKCNLQEEEALKIISKEEYDYLISLTQR